MRPSSLALRLLLGNVLCDIPRHRLYNSLRISLDIRLVTVVVNSAPPNKHRHRLFLFNRTQTLYPPAFKLINNCISLIFVYNSDTIMQMQSASLLAFPTVKEIHLTVNRIVNPSGQLVHNYSRITSDCIKANLQNRR